MGYMPTGCSESGWKRPVTQSVERIGWEAQKNCPVGGGGEVDLRTKLGTE